ncbi:SIR2 family protein [Gordonia McavH-238-E]|uniref:SIR2 family protein n=1 Tax=Gordonia sp. McavH-238-E TaxID=2917736 RepID=UPI001EF6F9C8|nr:SIR2 family protein [Gordonia sp. McavH-238-E]MCG7635309.1 SIR2 family protein [Gordonia sp. McavH-238-E]
MTDSADAGIDDPYLPLAFSMHSTPGAYAVLAGAGVSFGAVPTAWEIVVDLAQRVCRVRGDEATATTLTGDTVEDWFAATFNKPLTYGGILAEVAPGQHERGAVLREFFEPADSNGAPVLPEPTAAHRAIARLVADGTVRVIVTMNFDHLFEAALREVGVEPVVVATDSAAQGLPPLHTVECCVVHLHGSYRDASSMLNTDDELGTYKPHMHALLRDIVGSHGLLIAGWSAQWDHALRDTLRGNYRPFYTSAWINPSPLKGEAREVAAALGARAFEATADEAFTRLADAVAAMRTRQARHPLTAAVIVERIKRDLAGDHPAITAHDTFTAEAARVETLPALNLTNFNTVDRDHYAKLVAEIDEGCTVTVAAVATLARWGTAATDHWWLPLIEQWAHTIRANGQTVLLELPLLVATRFVYAAALGAVAGNRYETLARIIAVPAVGDHRNLSLLDLTDFDRQHAELPAATNRASRDRFAATVRDALSISTTQFDTVWQQFETVRITGQIMTSPNFALAVEQAAGAVREERTQRVAEANNPAHRRERIARRDEALRALATTASSYAPHVLMIHTMHEDLTHGRDRWISPVAQRLIERPDRDLINALAGILPKDLSALDREEYAAVALRASATYLDQYASQVNLRHLGWQATERWLDDTE